MQQATKKEVKIRKDRLTFKKIVEVSARENNEEQDPLRKASLFSLRNLRSSQLYITLFYPHHAVFIDSPLAYLRQSRLTLKLVYTLRAIYFLIKRNFTIDILDMDEKDHNNLVIDHNLWSALNMFHFSRGRIERMVYLLMLSGVNKKGKTLCVGPKNEGELLMFRSLGFTDVVGIDLFTYCPSIFPMDVANMTFLDSSFDTINCGSMLQYVEDLESVVNEIVRVAKPEAMVSLSLTVPDILASYAGDARAGSAQKTLDLFGTHVKHVYFRNDISPHSPGNKHEVVFQFTK